MYSICSSRPITERMGSVDFFDTISCDENCRDENCCVGYGGLVSRSSPESIHPIGHPIGFDGDRLFGDRLFGDRNGDRLFGDFDVSSATRWFARWFARWVGVSGIFHGFDWYADRHVELFHFPPRGTTP
jgi:hypothetical protein